MTGRYINQQERKKLQRYSGSISIVCLPLFKKSFSQSQNQYWLIDLEILCTLFQYMNGKNLKSFPCLEVFSDFFKTFISLTKLFSQNFFLKITWARFERIEQYQQKYSKKQESSVHDKNYALMGNVLWKLRFKKLITLNPN